MKKLLFIITVSLLFFTSCSGEAKTAAGVKSACNSSVYSISRQDNPVKLDFSNISSIHIKDIKNDLEAEYSDKNLINEFCSFLMNQSYSKPDMEWDKSYQAELLDNNREPILKMTFGERAISFDSDVILDKTVLKKGIYEVEQWISDSLAQLCQGAVLNPSYIKYPATITIPDSEYSLEIVSRGNSKVNQYQVYPLLYSFIGKLFSSKEFEIVKSKRVYSYEDMEKEASGVKKGSRCIIINYSGSENYYLDVNSTNTYKELVKCSSVILAKNQEKADVFEVLTDNMILDIKVKEDFVKGFDNIFTLNESTSRQITPGEIEKLHRENKPYYMDYICKNLGMEGWYDRPSELERKRLELNSTDKPYTVLLLSTPYNLRMFIFRENRDKSWRFMDYIDFGGRSAGTEYELKKAGSKIWVAGNRCRGHGTGEARYYREWYTVNENGKKLALSIPYDEYIMPPWGGYRINAEAINIQKNNGISITVEYNVTKSYMLDLEGSDEYGMLNVTGKKTETFRWDDKKGIFVSLHPRDEAGITPIPPECDDITRKCGDILEKQYDKLAENMKAIRNEQNEYTKEFKTKALENFLKDCEDSNKKQDLWKCLKDS